MSRPQRGGGSSTDMAALRRELQLLQTEFKGQAAAMRVMMETLEDTMPIEDTHALLKQERGRTAKELETHMEEVAVEMSDLEDRSQAACLTSITSACDELARRCKTDIDALEGHLSSVPWSSDVAQLREFVTVQLEKLEKQQREMVEGAERAAAANFEEHRARIDHVEQSHERSAEAVHSLAGRLDAALTDVEASLKSAAAQAERASAQAMAQASRTAAKSAEEATHAAAAASTERDNIRSETANMREEARVNVARLHDMITESNNKIDDVAAQLAERIEANTAGIDRDVAGVSQQLDTKLQRLGDNFADELQRMVITQEELAAKQIDERSLTVSAAEQISEQLGSLHKDSEATKLQIRTLETMLRQDTEKLETIIQTQVDGVDGRLEQLVRDFETGLAGLRVNVDLIQNEATEGNRRIDGISAALSDLGQDIATCGRDVSQNVKENAQCQLQIQELASQFEEKILGLDGQLEALSSELRSLDADAASQMTQQSSQIDDLGTQADQRHSDFEDKVRVLQEAHATHVEALRRLSVDLSARIADNGQSMKVAQEEWFGACTVLENQQNEVKAASLRRMEQIEESFRLSLANTQAKAHDDSIERWQEQSARIDDLDAQIRSSIDNNALHQQKSAHTVAAHAARFDRYEVDTVARLDSVREEFEQRVVQQGRIDVDARAHLEQAIFAARQKDTEREAQHMKISSEINAHQIRMEKLERNLQECSEQQKLELQRVQGDTQGGLVKLSELHRQDLDAHAQTQKQLLRESERTILIKVEETTAKTEAKFMELHSDGDTKMSAFAEAMRQMRSEIGADIRSQASQDAARAKSLVDSAIDSSTKAIRAETSSTVSELMRKILDTSIEREKPVARDIHELQAALKDVQQNTTEDSARLGARLSNLESSLEKLVEDTCSALDEHWSARVAENTQRIADFEIAAAKSAEISSVTIKQQFESIDAKLKKQVGEAAQVSAEHAAEVEARFTAAIDSVAASMSQVSKQHGERDAASKAQLVELNLKVQSALSDTEIAVREQITKAHTENFTRLGEIEAQIVNRAAEQTAQQEHAMKLIHSLRGETDSLRASTSQTVEEQRNSLERVATTLDKVAQQVDEQISTVYSDMSSTINTAQLTVEGQLNASVATQDRRLTAIEAACSETSATLMQQEQNIQSKLESATAKFSGDTDKRFSALAEEFDGRTSRLETLVDTNTTSLTQQAEGITDVATTLRREVAENNIALSNKVTEQISKADELRAMCETIAEQTQEHLARQQAGLQVLQSTFETQLNQSAACQNQQYVELQKALRDQEARLEEQGKLSVDIDESVSQIAQSVEQLRTNWRDESCFQSLSSLQQTLAAESDKLVAINQVVGEDRQRLQDLEASLNTIFSARQDDLKSSAEQIRGIDSVLTELLNTELPELRRRIDEIGSENLLMLGKDDPRIQEIEKCVNNSATDIIDSQTKIRQVNNEVARLFTELQGLVNVQVSRLDAVEGGLDERAMSACTAQLETLRSNVKEALESQIEPRLTAAEDGVKKIEKLRATVGQALEMLARVRAEWQESAARLHDLERRTA